MCEQLEADSSVFEQRVFLNVTLTDFSNPLTVEKLTELAQKFHQSGHDLVLELSEIFTPEELFDCEEVVQVFRKSGVTDGRLWRRRHQRIRYRRISVRPGKK